MKKTSLILSIIFLSISSACSQKENYPPIQDFDENLFELVKIIDGIDIPWGLAFTDNTSFLVTDKKGILYHVVDGKKKIIQGVPDIVFSRQGGLLDVAVDENFVSNQIIYFTASVSESEKGSNTSLFSAKLDGDILVDIKQLYKASPDSEEERHFGGSILLKNQHIYFTIGDRGNRDVNPQNINLDGGKVYRLNLDGSIPFDNPFFNSDNSKKAIWSFGHRNPQGIVNGFNDDEIWIHEHGPRGGDEINIIKNPKTNVSPLKDRNYGWPKATYGINYSGSEITKNKTLDGVNDPYYYWTPSIAPSGMVLIKSSKIYSDWNNTLLVGSLSFRYLERLKFDDSGITMREKLFPRIGRVRDVNLSPEGFVYLSVEGEGIFKILPN
jgi:glucose/arabinose dehydrogenase|tara:strand:+ start:54067 stop:55212 length:1146 start_codon:yes stop_codon:yes gene_type:complete